MTWSNNAGVIHWVKCARNFCFQRHSLHISTHTYLSPYRLYPRFTACACKIRYFACALRFFFLNRTMAWKSGGGGDALNNLWRFYRIVRFRNRFWLHQIGKWVSMLKSKSWYYTEKYFPCRLQTYFNKLEKTLRRFFSDFGRTTFNTHDNPLGVRNLRDLYAKQARKSPSSSFPGEEKRQK